MEASVEGTPRGGPLSPLLANIYLDALDRELERRGIDTAGTRMTAISSRQSSGGGTDAGIGTGMDEKHLRLKVNAAKSGTGRVLGT